MKYKVFVDGQSGTTGLKIHERLHARSDIELLQIDPALRKDQNEKKRLFEQADLVFLCLPDEAAKESVALASDRTKIIDASTAHRCNPDWVYGLPELNLEIRKALPGSKRVSVPGCHASAFLLGLSPLVKAGLIPADYPASCYSITGYSGAGKEAIQRYETEGRENLVFSGSRPYALGLHHKHLPEMLKFSGLSNAPLFTPIIGNFAQGLTVGIPLLPRLLPSSTSPEMLQIALAQHYSGSRFVKVHPYKEGNLEGDGYFDPQACNNTNNAEIFVFGHREQILILTRLDNLGKGASGAAIQCMNLMFGLDEGRSLEG